MKRVIIESPFGGYVPANIEYLQRCINDCINRGEAPFASHQMYTLALDDNDLVQRERGIRLGFEWWNAAERIIFYTDLGWSSGMRVAYRRAVFLHRLRAIRSLDALPLPYPGEIE